MKFNNKEKKLLSLIQKIKLSPSHGLDHIENVCRHAETLAKIYKGDRGIVIASAICHDLGRSDSKLHGKDSAKESVRLAKPLLIKAGYLEKEIKQILRAITEHDQPQLHSKNLESRILKDADFIDGFGTRGILRSIMHTVETGGDIASAIERLNSKASKRLKGLEFLESKRIAGKLHRFTELFLQELKHNQDIKDNSYKGRVIVIEGISGSGKSVQANLLLSYFNKKGLEAELVEYPTRTMKKLWRQWRKETNDPISELHLMIADQVNTTNTKLMKILNEGKIVIFARSSISSQVYQYVNDYWAFFSKYAFSFEPTTDMIIYLDIEPTLAFQRIQKKENNVGKKSFFGHVQKQEAKLYGKILSSYLNVVKVDGSNSIEQVHKEIVACVRKIF